MKIQITIPPPIIATTRAGPIGGERKLAEPFVCFLDGSITVDEAKNKYKK
jgi:hypothetical protein